MLDLKPFVLRFWESVFPQVAPLRSEGNQRLYTEEHVSILKRIQQLLHGQGMTIEGAKRILEGNTFKDESIPDIEIIQSIVIELKSIKDLLSMSEQR